MMENNNFKKMGEKAKIFAENFSWDKQIKKYIDLIKQN